MIPLIGSILEIGSKIIDRVWPDPEQRDRAKLELLKLAQEGHLRDLEAQMQIITSEARSEHWVTSAWRPITMLTFVAIVANNYIVAPYVQLFFGIDTTLPLPPDLWELIKIGLGGYVIGRSAEKIAGVIKNAGK